MCPVLAFVTHAQLQGLTGSAKQFNLVVEMAHAGAAGRDQAAKRFAVARTEIDLALVRCRMKIGPNRKSRLTPRRSAGPGFKV